MRVATFPSSRPVPAQWSLLAESKADEEPISDPTDESSRTLLQSMRLIRAEGGRRSSVRKLRAGNLTQAGFA